MSKTLFLVLIHCGSNLGSNLPAGFRREAGLRLAGLCLRVLWHIMPDRWGNFPSCSDLSAGFNPGGGPLPLILGPEWVT